MTPGFTGEADGMSVAASAETHPQPMHVPVTLDRDSAIPLWQQLYEQLAAAIIDGTLSPGQRFEQELSLADRLGLSRLTIRRTMSELVNHGLLIRGRGIGTVVARRSAGRTGGLSSLHGDLVAAGRTPATRLLNLDHPVTDARVARLMRMGAGTPLLYVERLRLVDGAPLAVLRNWLPPSAALVRFSDLQSHGLFATLRRHGLDPHLATQTIGSRLPTGLERELLGIDATDPVLTMTRLSFDPVGRPVAYGEHTYRADRYEFDLTVEG